MPLADGLDVSAGLARAYERTLFAPLAGRVDVKIVEPTVLNPHFVSQFLDSVKAGAYQRRRSIEERDVVGFVLKEMFFTKGVGNARKRRRSSSRCVPPVSRPATRLGPGIFPPWPICQSSGAKRLEPGQVTFVVMSEAATRAHRLIAATVGVAIPRDREFTATSPSITASASEEIAGDYAEARRRNARTTLGLEFDPDKSWDEKKEVYRLSNEIVHVQNVTQSAVGDKKGLWTTVVAAAVLVG